MYCVFVEPKLAFFGFEKMSSNRGSRSSIIDDDDSGDDRNDANKRQKRQSLILANTLRELEKRASLNGRPQSVGSAAPPLPSSYMGDSYDARKDPSAMARKRAQDAAEAAGLAARQAAAARADAEAKRRAAMLAEQRAAVAAARASDLAARRASIHEAAPRQSGAGAAGFYPASSASGSQSYKGGSKYEWQRYEVDGKFYYRYLGNGYYPPDNYFRPLYLEEQAIVDWLKQRGITDQTRIINALGRLKWDPQGRPPAAQISSDPWKRSSFSHAPDFAAEDAYVPPSEPHIAGSAVARSHRSTADYRPDRPYFLEGYVGITGEMQGNVDALIRELENEYTTDPLLVTTGQDLDLGLGLSRSSSTHSKFNLEPNPFRSTHATSHEAALSHLLASMRF